jgi:putative transposase
VQRRHAAHHLFDAYLGSASQCRVIGLQHPSFAYQAYRRDGTVLRLRLRELAQVRVREGSQRLYPLLRQEGLQDNHKRVHRLV